MKSIRSLVLALVAAALASPAFAEEAKCPSPLGECLFSYQAMRERPWIGVEVETDSVSRLPVIRRVMEGSPAQRAKLRVGDAIRSIDGQVPKDWFAGKAGWKSAGEPLAFEVVRKGAAVAVSLPNQRIDDERLARLIGIHMMQGHLAYMSSGDEHGSHEVH